jgi:hypothetical protein
LFHPIRDEGKTRSAKLGTNKLTITTVNDLSNNRITLFNAPAAAITRGIELRISVREVLNSSYRHALVKFQILQHYFLPKVLMLVM